MRSDQRASAKARSVDPFSFALCLAPQDPWQSAPVYILFFMHSGREESRRDECGSCERLAWLDEKQQRREGRKGGLNTACGKSKGGSSSSSSYPLSR